MSFIVVDQFSSMKKKMSISFLTKFYYDRTPVAGSGGVGVQIGGKEGGSANSTD